MKRLGRRAGSGACVEQRFVLCGAYEWYALWEGALAGGRMEWIGGALGGEAGQPRRAAGEAGGGAAAGMIKERDELIESMRQQMQMLKEEMRRKDEEAQRQEADAKERLQLASSRAKEVMRTHLQQFQAERVELQAQIERMQNEVQQQQAGGAPNTDEYVGSADAECTKCAELAAEQSRLQEQLQSLQAQVHEARESAVEDARHQAEHQALDKENDDKAQVAERERVASEQWSRERAKLLADLEQKTAECSQIAEELYQCKAQLQSMVEKADETSTSHARQVAELRSCVASLREEHDKINRRGENNDEDQTRDTHDIREMSAELEATKAARDAAMRQLEQERDRAEKNKAGDVIAITSMEATVAEQAHQISALRSEVDKKAEESGQARAELESIQAAMSVLQRKADEEKEAKRAVELDKRDETALNEAQKERDDAQELVEELALQLEAKSTELDRVSAELQQRSGKEFTAPGNAPPAAAAVADESLVNELLEQVSLAEEREKAFKKRLEVAEEETFALQKKVLELEDSLRQAEQGLEAANAAATAAPAAGPAVPAAPLSAASLPSNDTMVGRIKELEAALVEKEKESNKVKEKARQFLKELNQEKRELELKLKSETERMQAERDAREREHADALQRAEQESRDARVGARQLEGALTLVREKDERIGDLQRALDDSLRNVDALRSQLTGLEAEFEAYRSRAGSTLQQRTEQLKAARAETERLTVSLRVRAEEAERGRDELLARLDASSDVEAALVGKDRAIADLHVQIRQAHEERLSAELAASENISELTRQLEAVQSDLNALRSQGQDAEVRNGQLLLKVELAERGRADAIEQLEQLREQWQLEERGLRSRMKVLEEQITSMRNEARKARSAQSAVDRVAAAAQKAYNHDSAVTKRSGGTGEDSPFGRASAGGQLSQGSQSPFLKSLGMELNPAELENHDEVLSRLRAEALQTRSEANATKQELDRVVEELSRLRKEFNAVEGRLAAAQTLKDGVPYEFLKNVVLRFLETDDLNTLLPVMGTVLSFTPDEITSVKESRAARAKKRSSLMGRSWYQT
ncbi:Protein GRIP [Porphyridium purpureum]|uniref:Protein GRIP n=1 Tax=Porphyridium purpureum TaxID=35688 RepID=A0A5J4YZ25_PORPP|nr:Protein GRIP [Porphyridium purpureum]|eukprot:POR1227..scf209_3